MFFRYLDHLRGKEGISSISPGSRFALILPFQIFKSKETEYHAEVIIFFFFPDARWGSGSRGVDVQMLPFDVE